jgi:hypothetical protein
MDANAQRLDEAWRDPSVTDKKTRALRDLTMSFFSGVAFYAVTPTMPSHPYLSLLQFLPSAYFFLSSVRHVRASDKILDAKLAALEKRDGVRT